MIEPYVDIDANIGDSTHVRELASNLSRSGSHVTLIARSSQNSAFSAQNLEFRNVSMSGRRSTGLDLPRLLSAVAALYVASGVLLGGNVDVIHERQPFPIGLVLSKIFRVKCVTEINGFIADELDDPEFNRRIRLDNALIKKMLTVLQQLVMSNSDKIVVVTSDLKRAIHKIYRIPGERMAVVSNGVNTQLFKPTTVTAESLNLDPQCKYVCFVGNLHKVHMGVDYLIEAAPLVIKKVPNVSFLILGDGVMKQALQRRTEALGIADKFHFIGRVPNRDVPRYVNLASLCVAPYRRTKNFGFSPIKICEYLACGKPVVASDVGGIGELLTSSNSGITVTPDDTRAFSEAILMFLTNDQLARQMGDNGKREVVGKLSWEAVAERLLRIFGEVTGHPDIPASTSLETSIR
jgi:glycosyltransferase involved in cell wall biosynthesis